MHPSREGDPDARLLHDDPTITGLPLNIVGSAAMELEGMNPWSNAHLNCHLRPTSSEKKPRIYPAYSVIESSRS